MAENARSLVYHIPEPVRAGTLHREELVSKIVDQFAPLDGDPVARFNTFGAVRIAILETVLDLSEVYPQLSERIQARFGTCNTELVDG